QLSFMYSFHLLNSSHHSCCTCQYITILILNQPNLLNILLISDDDVNVVEVLTVDDVWKLAGGGDAIIRDGVGWGRKVDACRFDSCCCLLSDRERGRGDRQLSKRYPKEIQQGATGKQPKTHQAGALKHISGNHFWSPEVEERGDQQGNVSQNESQGE
ncbi:hypothetical protein XENOCAPTIV_006381, partial [Xenoophorus captivus]